MVVIGFEDNEDVAVAFMDLDDDAIGVIGGLILLGNTVWTRVDAPCVCKPI